MGRPNICPGLFRDIFRNSFLKFRDGRILTLFLNELNGFVYSHSEELGNAFVEYLLKCMDIQATIGAVWTGDSESANGAPASQPGATPQVKGRKQNEG